MTISARFKHPKYDSGNVPRSPYACDTHTHTLASRHAYSTLGECVEAAKAAGLELLGSTDHYSAMLHPDSPNQEQILRDYAYFINFELWPREWDGITVLRGVEADIVDLQGHLYGWDIPLTQSITGHMLDRQRTLKDRIWDDIDYAIASIHNHDWANDATLAQTTSMYVRALEDPKVLILGHPGRAGVPFDLDTVLVAAKELGKLVEINEHSFGSSFRGQSSETCRRIAERCAELGTMVATGTDAHIATAVGHFSALPAMLEEIHFPPELIATRTRGGFWDVLERHA